MSRSREAWPALHQSKVPRRFVFAWTDGSRLASRHHLRARTAAELALSELSSSQVYGGGGCAGIQQLILQLVGAFNVKGL